MYAHLHLSGYFAAHLIEESFTLTILSNCGYIQRTVYRNFPPSVIFLSLMESTKKEEVTLTRMLLIREELRVCHEIQSLPTLDNWTVASIAARFRKKEIEDIRKNYLEFHNFCAVTTDKITIERMHSDHELKMKFLKFKDDATLAFGCIVVIALGTLLITLVCFGFFPMLKCLVMMAGGTVAVGIACYAVLRFNL